MLSDQSKLRVAEDVTYQSMGPDGGTVILSLKSGVLFTCNKTTADFLAAVDGVRTIEHIVEQLAQIYDVSRHKLHTDLMAMAEKMIDEKLIFVSE